ncbi:MAG: hypothetical protein QXR17_05055 [Candidatus Bathyarchaeia archaeon]|nr:hypothetical protein [Candidatus Bathyarchaeota archaeon]
MSKSKAGYASKLKRAVHLLFYKRHAKPGVKGWELRKAIGSDYVKVLEILDKYLKNLDLQVKTFFEGGESSEKANSRELDQARFYVTLRGELTPKEAKMVGWRIDDLAGLAVAICYIISRNGKVSRKEVEELLSEKIPGWRVSQNIDRYIRYGYLAEDENGQLYLDWRTLVEVDQKALIDMMLSEEVK